MGCQIKCGGTTESTNVLDISGLVTCTVKFSIKENFKLWIFSFLEGNKYIV